MTGQGIPPETLAALAEVNARVSRLPDPISPDTPPDDHAEPCERRCVVCGGSLAGRRPQTRTCSHACQLHLSRGTLPPKPRPCEHCGETFTPKRSDGRYCPDCRRREPWRRTPRALESPDPDNACVASERGNGPRLVAWMEWVRPALWSSLNGDTKTVRRWKEGANPRSETVERVLERNGLMLEWAPDDVWEAAK